MAESRAVAAHQKSKLARSILQEVGTRNGKVTPDALRAMADVLNAMSQDSPSPAGRKRKQ
jgi:hypothetical protein